MWLERWLVGGFEERVRDIFEKGYKYGLKSVGGTAEAASRAGPKFIEACHEGFGLAQNSAVELLLCIQGARGVQSEALKEARRARNKAEEQQVLESLNSLDQQEAIVRKLMDGIAWQLIHHQLHVARRLWLGSRPPSLYEPNLEVVLAHAVAMNKANPASFALLSDVTSFVQIGDIVQVDYADGRVHFIECKEGSANDEILDFVAKCGESPSPDQLEDFRAKNGDGKYKQLCRVLRQDERGRNLERTLNTGIGIDPVFQAPIEISDDTIVLKSFTDRLAEALVKSREKGWAIDLIDECLYVGAYCGPLPMEAAFTPWVKSSTRKLILPYPVVDLRSSLFVPLMTPLFVSGLPETDLMDIAFGRMVVMMYYDIDGLVQLAEAAGITATWEPNPGPRVGKMTSGAYSYLGNRTLVLTYNGRRLFLQDGMIARVLYDWTYPAETVRLMKETLTHDWKVTGDQAEQRSKGRPERKR